LLDLFRDNFPMLAERIVASLPAIGSGILVAFAFWLVALVARMLIRRLEPRLGTERRDLMTFFGGFAYWALLAFGLVSGIGTMGVDVGALIAGLGLTGFALGFALRDAVSNVLAGILVLLYRPVRRGERIKVGDFEGRIVDIDLRYTKLDSDDRTILVPNQTLFQSPITIWRDPRTP
jgi:small conductance mechanosensitive channel